MKKIVLMATAVMLAVLAGEGKLWGQTRPKLTPAQQQRLEKQRQDTAAAKPSSDELNIARLEVGASGRPQWIDAKVMQVIDDNSMLVGIEDSRTGNGRYSTWIMLKAPTAGITDGKFWRGGQWKEVTGSAVLVVTGTTTYKEASGGTKTVFVVKPSFEERKPAAPATSGKRGAAAYDDFIDPVRDLLVDEWNKEIEAVKKAMSDDEQRVRAARTPGERQRYERWINEYKDRLEKLERNDPPYINLDSLKKKK